MADSKVPRTNNPLEKWMSLFQSSCQLGWAGSCTHLELLPFLAPELSALKPEVRQPERCVRHSWNLGTASTERTMLYSKSAFHTLFLENAALKFCTFLLCMRSTQKYFCDFWLQDPLQIYKYKSILKEHFALESTGISPSAMPIRKDSPGFRKCRKQWCFSGHCNC